MATGRSPFSNTLHLGPLLRGASLMQMLARISLQSYKSRCFCPAGLGPSSEGPYLGGYMEVEDPLHLPV